MGLVRLSVWLLVWDSYGPMKGVADHMFASRRDCEVVAAVMNRNVGKPTPLNPESYPKGVCVRATIVR